LIKTSTGTYIQDTIRCDGSTAAIILALSCTIPSSVLNSSPFSLAWGSSIYAQIVAYNIYGNSATSDSGNGAIILTRPASPTNLIELVSARTATSVGLQWTIGATNGGADVIDYTVSYD